MIFFVYTSQLLSILYIIFHYNQHFQCKKKSQSSHSQSHSPRSPLSSPSSPRSKRNLSIQDLKHHSNSAAFVRTFKSPQRCCSHCFQSVDGEQFDLFPVSFLFYLMFILMISTLILIKQFFFDYYDGDHSLYHSLHYSENPLIHVLRGEDTILKTTRIRTEHYQNSDILDWIICYCVMILSIVESWCNFHRYYVTKFTSKHFFNPEISTVVRTFSVYVVVYVLLFTLFIHFMYWIFPLVVGLHGIFNVFCTWKFCAILIERYKFYANVEKGLKHIHQELLCTAFVIRRASMLSALLSSIYVALFCVVYDVDVVVYLPLIWSASNFSFLFNFVRNRVCIQKNLYFITRCMKSKDVKSSGSTNVNTKDTLEIKVPSHKMDGAQTSTNTKKILVTLSGGNDDVVDVVDVHSTTNTNADTVSSNASNITPFPMKTTKKPASPCFLDIPTPTAADADTFTTDEPEMDSEYQQWYMDRKQNATFSSLRISISNKTKNRTTNSPRNLKLFDVLGIDKTPLSQDNDHNEIPLAYDMAPVNATLDGGKAQTPTVGMFGGMWKRASSLIQTQSDLEHQNRPKLRSRTRSSSDPTMLQMNTQATSKNEEAPQNRLVLHISQTSNQSEPPMEDVNRLKPMEFIASYSMMNLTKTACGSEENPNPKLIVPKARAVHAQSIPNDVLLSVLVQHGFCSRSSFNAAKQLRSYIQGK